MTWRSTFVDNRTLSQVADGAGNRYETQDVQQVGFWSNIGKGLQKAWGQASWSDRAQALLDVGGMLPGVGMFFDAASGGVSPVRGDKLGVGLSIIAMAPFAGDATAGVAKLARWGIKFGDNVTGALKLGRAAGAKALNRAADFAGLRRVGDAGAVGRILDDVPTRQPLIGRLSDSIEADGTFLRFGGGCFSEDTQVITSQYEAFANRSATTLHTITSTAIHAVALGSRVVGENPRLADVDLGVSEPNAGSWVRIEAHGRRSDGAFVEMEVLRPRSWAASNGITIGAQVDVSRPELNLKATATIQAVTACPPIAEGEGHVVTGRFVTHDVSNLVRLRLGDGTPIDVTDSHLFWSADRQDWVPAGELLPGERLDGMDGGVEVVNVTSLGYAPKVHNLEVHGQHVFRVAAPGVLVHNTNPGGCGPNIVAPARAELEILVRHRAGNTQVMHNGARWNVPTRDTSVLRQTDALGDHIQQLANQHASNFRFRPTSQQRETLARLNREGRSDIAGYRPVQK